MLPCPHSTGNLLGSERPARAAGNPLRYHILNPHPVPR